jgi:hypothetical protein
MLSACRVGPFVTDALLAPFPDAAADAPADLPGAPCDLLAQNCAVKRSCYPVDGQPGKTSCELTGSAPPSTACVMSLECDALEACVFVAEAQVSMCVTLCNPSAAQTGCLPRAVCRPMPGYRAGFCVP